ncbi:hypothetical protein MID13_17515 [Vibrio gigantis]|uniref:hypothetical protein n=1 Tax=Vibrio gigantis TaxID=296199 RepID=UPI001EFBBCD0|nr:hypothetical protein [Vibrio gigantis]ULN66918.1 hypothetical protein MID13_17515 [Vibrio gigantis]
MFVRITNCSPLDYATDIERQKAIQSFLDSHGERTHIVQCKKSVCDDIIRSGLFGDIHNKFASDLLDMKHEIGTLKHSFEIILIIDFNFDDSYIESTLDGGIFKITASHHFLLRSSFKNKCIFLAEDESDCEFFTLIAKTITKSTFGKSVNISFNNLEGGGARTHKKYLKILNEREFGVCIVDNDKKHPKGPEGSTSSVFKPARNQRGYAVNQECIVLDFHEAESIIPQDVLQKIIDPSKIDTLDKIGYYDKISDFQFRRFFDHKNGIELSKGWELDGKHANGFWNQFFSKERNYQSKPCRANKVCINEKHDIQCHSCIKIEGFGDKILVDSIEEMENIHLKPIYSKLTPQLRSQWNYIGRKLINWGCTLSLPPIKSF